MPPYGKEGGSTRRSYTPNLYGATTSSSAAKNLPQIFNRRRYVTWAIYLPARVFTELPVRCIYQFGFCPYTRRPVFTINFREWSVSYVPTGNGDQVGRNWDRLFGASVRSKDMANWLDQPAHIYMLLHPFRLFCRHGQVHQMGEICGSLKEGQEEQRWWLHYISIVGWDLWDFYNLRGHARSWLMGCLPENEQVEYTI